MPYFERNGCSLHYQEFGQGSPVLLVHGLGSSAQDWEYQIPALVGQHRVIAVDVRGHGRSGKPRERYSIPGFSADIKALLDHLQPGPVHLVGLSMGGMIGFQLAVDHPQLLKSLTIVNSAPEVKIKSLSDVRQFAKRWLLARVFSMEAIGKALGKNLFPKPEQADLRHKIAKRWAQNEKHAYLASFSAIVGWGVQEKLSRIQCPTLVVTAKYDYTPVALKEVYVRLIHEAKLVVIEDSRHATPLDRPEEFNRALLEFLKDVDASSQE
ncbi:alpha/beta hydrolase [Pseudomonas sp. RC10]|uniref:alpha/beta fold hydrolase n=1 Tax=Pseudomonas bambusae TaxID=3139142 RepID=UPI0031389EF3